MGSDFRKVVVLPLREFGLVLLSGLILILLRFPLLLLRLLLLLALQNETTHLF